MSYKILADAIVVIHFLWIIFIIVGFVLTLIAFRRRSSLIGSGCGRFILPESFSSVPLVCLANIVRSPSGRPHYGNGTIPTLPMSDHS